MFFLHTTLTKQFEYFSSLLTNEESGNSVWECTVIRKETCVEMFPLSLPFCSRFYALLSSAELLKGTKERAAALCFKMPLNGCWRAVRAAHILLWMATNKPEECTHPYTLTDGRGNCWILPGFCAPWTSCSPFSNAVPESTHTHTHTHTQHTHKNRQTHYNPSECSTRWEIKVHHIGLYSGNMTDRGLNGNNWPWPFVAFLKGHLTAVTEH